MKNFFKDISWKKSVAIADKKEFLRGFLGLLAAIALMYLGTRFIGLQNIQEKIMGFGIWGPIIFVLLKASTVVFAPLSGGPLYIAAGPLFGFGPGFLYVTAGDILGNSAAFFISRFFGQKIIEKLLSKGGVGTVHNLLGNIMTTKGLILARAAFIGFPEAVSYAAGLTDLYFWRFFLVSEGVMILPRALLVFSGGILLQRAFTALAIITVGSILAIFIASRFYGRNGR